MTQKSLSNGSYWPHGTHENDKRTAIEAFERQIYPLWASIETDAIASDRAATQKEIDDIEILSECVTMHRQDNAIRNSGIKPLLVGSDQERITDLRRRSSRAYGTGPDRSDRIAP